MTWATADCGGGDVVQWEGQTCVVRRRRAVDGLAMFQTDTHEVFLASIEVGDLSPEWVPECECVRQSIE